jgi:hypothetical protein
MSSILDVSLKRPEPEDLLVVTEGGPMDGSSVKIRYHSLENLNESRAAMIERAAGMTYQDDENRDILLFLGIDEPTEEEAGADTGDWKTTDLAGVLFEEEY